MAVFPAEQGSRWGVSVVAVMVSPDAVGRISGVTSVSTSTPWQALNTNSNEMSKLRTELMNERGES
jgi:hypothetical protein